MKVSNLTVTLFRSTMFLVFLTLSSENVLLFGERSSLQRKFRSSSEGNLAIISSPCINLLLRNFAFLNVDIICVVDFFYLYRRYCCSCCCCCCWARDILLLMLLQMLLLILPNVLLPSVASHTTGPSLFFIFAVVYISNNFVETGGVVFPKFL